MGLDISIHTNIDDNLHQLEKNASWEERFNKFSLSREFCNFMCRQNVVNHLPELDQIGKLTGVNIAPIYAMEAYPDEEYTSYQLEYDATTEQQREDILAAVEADKKKLEGNIDGVILTINALIEKLSTINNLQYKLIKTDFDTLHADYYFSDFTSDKGEGYIRNNFGQDLRNFQRFLAFVKEHGATTVWFRYG